VSSQPTSGIVKTSIALPTGSPKDPKGMALKLP
jgi:hypothetical protein